MKLINEYYYEIKKSKFIGYYFEINNIEEINNIIENIKKKNKNAKHFPYAYKINNNIKKTDDKEPNGTSGTPILNIIERNNLNNCLIIIVRYFGGIKLGAGNLLRAYNHTAKEVIKKDS